MYYCIACNQVHPSLSTKNEVIFKTGFHYMNSTMYSAGICKTGASTDQNELQKSATA
ncbi:hypothetical protein ACVLD2_003103 [Paenibacillus sp. PvR052]|nr:hypothetical protein [Paenibacillus sp. PvP091]MBP1168423.1 hypothetical protein [Paenibacillus sp. PvR098]MBP2439451.1 hypothetical protein [Paenibacillus sp. PvP052]